MAQAELSDLYQETRTFAPPAWFREQARVRDRARYEDAARDLEGYWAQEARELDWFAPWSRVLDWTPPTVRWFVGGKLNARLEAVMARRRGAAGLASR